MVKTTEPNIRETETENRIFTAALEVFSEHGKNGARMQDIADRAGINKALVHYYFRSKERLYEAVFDYIMRHYFTLLAETIERETDFASMLRVFIDKYMDLLITHPRLPRFIMREVGAGAPVFGRKLRTLLESMKPSPPKVFFSAYEAALSKGEVRQVDPMHVFVTVLGACVYPIIAAPIITAIDPKVDSKTFAVRHKKELFDIIYHGLKPRKEMKS